MVGLPRGSLTRELIVRESLRLLDTYGVAGFSLPKLGRAIGADPTAIYRHFTSKDELVLAIADALIAEGTEGLQPSSCWVRTLEEVARRARKTYVAHPAAASLAVSRTTQGPAEMRVVDMILGALHAAGFAGKEAATAYRAFGDFCQSWGSGEAMFLALDERTQKTDNEAWTRAYLVADREVYPNIWRMRENLPVVDDEDIFETILSLVLAGLTQRAPRPCGCAEHQAVPPGQLTAAAGTAPGAPGPGRRPAS